MGIFARNDFLRDALLQLLRRHFPNGYRLNSPIAMRQLRERWREDHGGEELLASDHAVRADGFPESSRCPGLAAIYCYDVSRKVTGHLL